MTVLKRNPKPDVVMRTADLRTSVTAAGPKPGSAVAEAKRHADAVRYLEEARAHFGSELRAAQERLAVARAAFENCERERLLRELRAAESHVLETQQLSNSVEAQALTACAAARPSRLVRAIEATDRELRDLRLSEGTPEDCARNELLLDRRARLVALGERAFDDSTLKDLIRALLDPDA